MVISGYDPEDLDDALETMMRRGKVEDYLTDEEREQWEGGENLLELLDEDDIRRLLDEAPEEVTPD